LVSGLAEGLFGEGGDRVLVASEPVEKGKAGLAEREQVWVGVLALVEAVGVEDLHSCVERHHGLNLSAAEGPFDQVGLKEL
jgi:hypothetical protein